MLFVIRSYSLSNDWNQWRGPNRTGIIAEFSAPSIWPQQLKQMWKVQIGLGHSSPIVSGSRIYAFSRVGEQEVISALDAPTGKLLWKESYDAPYTMNPAAMAHGKGPKSTPLVVNNKLYTLGITGVLSAYDATSGKLLWRNNFKTDFPVTAPEFGTAMSPALFDGMLIVHAGGAGNGALMSLDPASGKPKWKWNGDGPAYASPIVVDLAGTRQIVTQTQKNIVGVSLKDGALLWQIPFVTDYEQNAVTPVAYKDLLIFSGISKGAFGVKVTNQNGKWIPETVWKNDRAGMYLSSPVVVGDFLFGMSHFRKGQFFCLDPKTGTTLWTSNAAEGENASIVSPGNLLLFLNNDAELTIAKTTEKQYEPLKKYTVAQSPTWAHPALLRHQIVIKDLDSLIAWTW
jgi:outer membrane protein assembly factor BamB